MTSLSTSNTPPLHPPWSEPRPRPETTSHLEDVIDDVIPLQHGLQCYCTAQSSFERVTIVMGCEMTPILCGRNWRNSWTTSRAPRGRRRHPWPPSSKCSLCRRNNTSNSSSRICASFFQYFFNSCFLAMLSNFYRWIFQFFIDFNHWLGLFTWFVNNLIPFLGSWNPLRGFYKQVFSLIDHIY